MKKAVIMFKDSVAGTLSETEDGYRFEYDQFYLSSSDAKAVSLTLPLRKQPFTSNVLFPFFDGLIPEGWLLDIAERNWKISPNDRMALLMACCKDCIGAVSVLPMEDKEE